MLTGSRWGVDWGGLGVGRDWEIGRWTKVISALPKHLDSQNVRTYAAYTI